MVNYLFGALQHRALTSTLPRAPYSSIVTCLFVDVRTCLPNCCLAMEVPSGSTISEITVDVQSTAHTEFGCLNFGM
jgi:hypothetical protein